MRRVSLEVVVDCSIDPSIFLFRKFTPGEFEKREFDQALEMVKWFSLF
jgi:hypothetical protein